VFTVAECLASTIATGRREPEDWFLYIKYDQYYRMFKLKSDTGEPMQI
jgi:hypothetical protein